MTKKTKTISLQGKDYAQVKDRLKEFRQDCPNGLIETTPTIDGTTIVFKARVLKDKSDQTSGEATGHSYGENKGTKAFEKLETIAVGRALALLGYAQDGEIASGEEMEEFLTWQDNKKQEAILDGQEKLTECKNKEELMKVWASLSAEVKIALKGQKDELKKRYETA